MNHSLILSQNVSVTFNKYCASSPRTKSLLFSVLQILWRTLMKPQRTKQTDESFFPPSAVYYYFLPPYGLTKGISSCGETVVKGAMHHLRRPEPLWFRLPRQHNNNMQIQRVLISVGCGHAEKRGLKLL